MFCNWNLPVGKNIHLLYAKGLMEHDLLFHMRMKQNNFVSFSLTSRYILFCRQKKKIKKVK